MSREGLQPGIPESINNPEGNGADYFRKIRTNLGISQRMLAEKIGTTHDQISRIETGEAVPSWEYALRFCTILNKLEVDELVQVMNSTPHARRQNLYRTLCSATAVFHGLLNFDESENNMPSQMRELMTTFLSEWEIYLDNYSRQTIFNKDQNKSAGGGQ